MKPGGALAMTQLFTVGEEATHVVGDPRCPECLEAYPERCRCGGLIHAASGEQDEEGAEWPVTRCDRCGRSEEEEAEDAAAGRG
jgi:hypothetical protein